MKSARPTTTALHGPAPAVRSEDGTVASEEAEPDHQRPGTARRGPPGEREWLVTNGLGGYAAGTVSGRLTRRYHGLLVAALPAPLGRVLTLVDLAATLELPDAGAALGCDPRLLPEDAAPRTARLATFRLDRGLPVWTWDTGSHRVRKRVALLHGRNTVVVEYELMAGDAVEMLLRPVLDIRNHEDPVGPDPCPGARAEEVDGALEVRCEGDRPPLWLRLSGRMLYGDDPRTIDGLRYAVEDARGYPAIGSVWSPGTMGTRLEPGGAIRLVASTDPEEADRVAEAGTWVQAELDRRGGVVERAGAGADPSRTELALAADAFVVTPATHGSHPGQRSVIAGYHWFTDWGRDTMISLEGLTLATGRREEAAAILRTFGSHVRDGLIPNHFTEGEGEGLYHTADATLWFFHAVHRYVETTGDRDLLTELVPTFRDILHHHIEGTRFGIRVDPGDDLLSQGAPGYALTWMDAKVDDWVVTPRRGKAVEINALWYNALRLAADWLRGPAPEEPARLDRRAERTRASFNRRFWYDAGGYLYDLVDGEDGAPDTALRPNQLLAFSLDHPVLDETRWSMVLERVREKLLTPVGLRSLDPAHPDYAPRYHGDLRSRDAAYHQGTVWGWLIGPWVDAWLRVHPDRTAEARAMLGGLLDHLSTACVGSLSEIFDAEPPHTPRGCVAQAWTVAEVLRCLDRTNGRTDPPPDGSG